MSLFDSILEMVEEGDRATFQKYAKVAEKVNEADSYVSAWESWKKEHWDSDRKMTKASAEALRIKDEEIAALRAMQGEEVDWDSIAKNVETTARNLMTSSGVVTKEQLEKEILPKLAMAKPDDVKAVMDKVNNLERGMEFTYAKTAHLPTAHFIEFGTPMKIEDLFKFMTDNKLTDVDDAYGKMVSEKRQAKNEEATKAREEKIRAEAKEEAMKEFTLKGGALPTDDRGSATEMSALQRRINAVKKVEEAGAPKLEPGELGSNASAQQAYSAWLKNQAEGKTLVQ